MFWDKEALYRQQAYLDEAKKANLIHAANRSRGRFYLKKAACTMLTKAGKKLFQLGRQMQVMGCKLQTQFGDFLDPESVT